MRIKESRPTASHLGSGCGDLFCFPSTSPGKRLCVLLLLLLVPTASVLESRNVDSAHGPIIPALRLRGAGIYDKIREMAEGHAEGRPGVPWGADDPRWEIPPTIPCRKPPIDIEEDEEESIDALMEWLGKTMTEGEKAQGRVLVKAMQDVARNHSRRFRPLSPSSRCAMSGTYIDHGNTVPPIKRLKRKTTRKTLILPKSQLILQMLCPPLLREVQVQQRLQTSVSRKHSRKGSRAGPRKARTAHAASRRPPQRLSTLSARPFLLPRLSLHPSPLFLPQTSRFSIASTRWRRTASSSRRQYPSCLPAPLCDVRS